MAKGKGGKVSSTTKKRAAKTKDSEASDSVEVCGLCRESIKDEEDEALFCEGPCAQWFHRYCAGVTATQFQLLSNSPEPFFCYACFQQAHRTKVSSLEEKVAALTAEIVEIKRALERLDSASSENASWSTVVKRGKSKGSGTTESNVRKTKPKEPGSNSVTKNRARGGELNSKTVKKASAFENKPRSNNSHGAAAGKRKVPGARRVWGPLHLCSPNAVLGCIKKLTGTNAQLRIRKKTKDLTNNKTIWWFVLHGDEKDLCILDEEWNKVHLQTSWRLENCFAPLNTDSEYATNSSSHPPTNLAECNLNHPNHSSPTTTKVAATTDSSTVPIIDESTPATTLTISKDPKQQSITDQNYPIQNSTSVTQADESSTNLLNHNVSAREDETSHS